LIFEVRNNTLTSFLITRRQALIAENCELYLNAATHQSKKDVCESIMKLVRGRFLRFVTARNEWAQISEDAARVKIAQAFQYRQRRLSQRESGRIDGGSGQESDEQIRKRPLSPVPSIWPNRSPPGGYPTSQHTVSSESVDNYITIEEIRWALGLQPSLPEQQQPNPATSRFSSMNSIDDFAIGRPAALSASHNPQNFQVALQSSRDVNDISSAMGFNSMLASAAARTENTSASLMHSQSQYQSFLQNRQNYHGRLQQLQQPQQQIPQFHGQYLHQNHASSSTVLPFGSVYPSASGGLAHANPREALESQLQTSFQTQAQLYPYDGVHFKSNMDASAREDSLEGYVMQQQQPVFDASFLSSSSHPFIQQESTDGMPNSVQIGTQQQMYHPIQSQDFGPAFQDTLDPHPLLLDPLPLNDNESLDAEDKTLERLGYNNSAP
jgi:hypothetical protein